LLLSKSLIVNVQACQEPGLFLKAAVIL
jgi:hypothetical protein